MTQQNEPEEEYEPRDVRRSRGFMRKAQDAHRTGELEKRDFLLAQAEQRLLIGLNKSMERIAEAQETANLIKMYDLVEDLDLTDAQWSYIDKKLVTNIAKTVLDDGAKDVQLLEKIVHGEEV